MNFRLLFVGDAVGSAGCSAVLVLIPNLCPLVHRCGARRDGVRDDKLRTNRVEV